MITNTCNDQNLLSIFWKPLITKSKWRQKKLIQKKICLHFNSKKQKYWTFAKCILVTSQQEMSERTKFNTYKNDDFFENWLYQEQRPFEEKNRYKEQIVVQ